MSRANTRASIARHAQGANQANQVGLEYVLVSSLGPITSLVLIPSIDISQGESNSYAK